MSRLIDADLLELDTEWNEYEDGFMSYSKMQIDNAETVKAIPIERLEKIKAEIETEMESFFDDETYISANMVLNIIDKAIKEQNE